MKTQLTERDKKLLFGLGIIAIIAAFVLLGIRPLISSIQDRDDQITTAKDTLAIDQQEQAALPVMQKSNSDAESEITADTKDYYDKMTSDEVDKLLTSLVLSEGLSSKDLTITMPDAEADVSKYLYAESTAESSAEGTDMSSADSTASGTESSTESSASGKTNLTDSAAYESEASDMASSADSTGMAGTNVYAVEATMTVFGPQATCQKLIDDLTVQYPSMRLTGFAWDETAYNTITTDSNGNIVVPTDSDTKVLKMNLEIYMVDRTAQKES